MAGVCSDYPLIRLLFLFFGLSGQNFVKDIAENINLAALSLELQ
jgi:hypothetical protein